tara:strand:+ start:1527 stop:2363 length:837 start_codon:yes stop_codon:yes gene_type:complete
MRYQYTSSGFKNSISNNSYHIPQGVKLLLIVNSILFAMIELSGMKNIFFISFGLVPQLVWEEYKIWQLFTYQFIHGSFLHVFFNMLILWMFGQDLEKEWGKKEFLFFYFICGIGSGIITIIFGLNSFVPVVGASGAIYGVLVAFGCVYPNRVVYLYGLLPIKVKYMILGLGLVSFFASIYSNNSNISHITHLSGMVIGLLLIYYNITFSKIKFWYFKRKNISTKTHPNYIKNHKKLMRKKVDKILDKLKEGGWDNLSNEEINYLNKATKEMYNDNTPN